MRPDACVGKNGSVFPTTPAHHTVLGCRCARGRRIDAVDRPSAPVPLRSRRALPFPCPSLTPSDHSPLVPPSQFEDLWKEHLRERKDFEIRNRSGVTSTVLRQHTYISSLAASNPAPPPMVLSRHGSMPGAPPRAPNPPRQHVRAVVVPAPPMMYAQAARGGPSYRPPSSGYAHAARGQVLPRPRRPRRDARRAPSPPRARRHRHPPTIPNHPRIATAVAFPRRRPRPPRPRPVTTIPTPSTSTRTSSGNGKSRTRGSTPRTTRGLPASPPPIAPRAATPSTPRSRRRVVRRRTDSARP